MKLPNSIKQPADVDYRDLAEIYRCYFFEWQEEKQEDEEGRTEKSRERRKDGEEQRERQNKRSEEREEEERGEERKVEEKEAMEEEAVHREDMGGQVNGQSNEQRVWRSGRFRTSIISGH